MFHRDETRTRLAELRALRDVGRVVEEFAGDGQAVLCHAVRDFGAGRGLLRYLPKRDGAGRRGDDLVKLAVGLLVAPRVVEDVADLETVLEARALRLPLDGMDWCSPLPPDLAAWLGENLLATPESRAL